MSHEKSKCHLKCMASWSGYLSAKSIGSVVTQVSAQNKKEIIENRNYLKKIIDIVLYLTRQGISFRGHDETKDSLNQGNFKEACQLMAKHDIQFKIKQESKFNFTSPDIQNELINVCSDVLKTNIISQIKSVGFFAIMVDDARCHKVEYMSICVRYVKDLEVYERFLGFMDVSEKQDAQTLINTIFQFLEHSNLGNIPIFAQSYDGASVMSGKRNGVQSKLLERYPCAIYTHCMAHRINLVVVDMCKNVEYAKSFFNSLEALYVYFSRPSTNKKLKDMQLKMDIKASSITRISDTRWVCRYKNCKAVKDNFEVILEVLREEIDANSNLDVAQAIGIEAMIKKGHFILFLIILEDILTKINILSNLMQEKKATLGKSVNLINSIIKTFENDRCSEKFKTVWTEVIALAKEFNISLEIPAKGSKRKRKETTNLQNYYVSNTTGAECSYANVDELNEGMNDEDTQFEYWKVNGYFRILDCVLSGLRSRFSTESLKIGHSIDNFMKLKYDESLHFIEHYENALCIDKDQLKAEMLIMKNCINKDDFDIGALVSEINKKIFPNLYKLLQVALTIPVSSASCERSFSVMRRIKTWLRNSMSNDRFSNLSLLHIERDLANNITSEEVLNIFAQKSRRLNLTI
ncbi:zinc finger MYM-type protein 1-like [Rhopalosiphum padi]|uniref:zinc finger MYM-type protein 1-like n=2 Tax=Rhopalosiphum padi TaxID=40932 RepID=UPI00298D7FAB|nr:zinc finger MYM-type protein 1-like [Rhopalosiphum padi]